MRTTNRGIPFLVVVALLLSPLSLLAAPVQPAPSKPSAEKVIFFAADGMRPDLMEKYAGEGVMPTYAELMATGVKGVNGLVQAFPPNTGVGWYSLATGNYPSEHGSTNNTFFRTGDAFNNRTAAFSGGAALPPAQQVLQADTIAESAERAGKKVVSVEWAGGARTMTLLKGPVVDYRNFYSNRGLWTNWDVPGQPAGANAFGVQYQRSNLAPVLGDWNSNCPALANAPQQGTFDIAGGTAIANSKYDFYVYDSDNNANYDRVLIVPNAAGKDCSKAVANLAPGEWADVKVVLANPAGKTGGFYVKAMLLPLICLSSACSSARLPEPLPSTTLWALSDRRPSRRPSTPASPAPPQPTTPSSSRAWSTPTPTSSRDCFGAKPTSPT